MFHGRFLCLVRRFVQKMNNLFALFSKNPFQVGEKEHLVEQLREEIKKEESNFKHQENLQLCQVTHTKLSVCLWWDERRRSSDWLCVCSEAEAVLSPSAGAAVSDETPTLRHQTNSQF